jgi:hypothetical protein
MTDEQLVAAFESTELSGDQFTHTNHVRVAWWYLRQGSLPEALLRFSTALRRFADAKGAPGKYHETITVAYVLIIAERLADHPNTSWTEFAAANPDLLTRTPSPLAVFYTDEMLMSERARRTFVMPTATAARHRAGARRADR